MCWVRGTLLSVVLIVLARWAEAGTGECDLAIVNRTMDMRELVMDNFRLLTDESNQDVLVQRIFRAVGVDVMDQEASRDLLCKALTCKSIKEVADLLPSTSDFRNDVEFGFSDFVENYPNMRKDIAEAYDGIMGIGQFLNETSYPTFPITNNGTAVSADELRQLVPLQAFELVFRQRLTDDFYDALAESTSAIQVTSRTLVPVDKLLSLPDNLDIWTQAFGMEMEIAEMIEQSGVLFDLS